MSYEIVKSIVIQSDKVYLTGADSSIRPLSFSKWECTPLSKILVEEGRSALLSRIGEEVWNGNMHLQKGSKLCNLFLTARNAFPAGWSFMTFDGKTAGAYLAKMVEKLEKEPSADLSSDVEEMLNLRNNREYILESARKTGHNYLDLADKELQQDREFALEVVKAGQGRAWFTYPAQFTKDKDFAMEALKQSGCFYRSLDHSLRSDRDIIKLAFQEIPEREFHEHLPDLIPLDAYCIVSDDNAISMDRDFIFELLELCPSMHLERFSMLLEDREVALKWCEVGKFFPHSVANLPDEFVQDEEFQNTLLKRFPDGEKHEILMQRFALKGLILSEPSLDGRIKNAKSRQTLEQKPDMHLMNRPER